MKLEKTKDEILIRLPANIDIRELETLLDYFNYQEKTANSEASQEEVDQLAEEVNQKIWERFQKQRFDK